ncbi:alpha/beta hydrolase [Microbacterium hydrocarbonoxydans]|uniref:alpha/beta hydrolase n=1 Tax=Microbacterium hydrocarbonoxydans TaxID=273678 RepID=UPI0007BBFF2E|nr:alpha/beta hydrolase [Microbacterium hydrocarbonoxydans]GAT71787.1 hypothetical protein MHM582_0251 [Microbacterium sp. HM58-2]
MTSAPALIARGIRVASAVSPALGGALADRAFFSTAPRMRVHERDEATHDAATRSRLRIGPAEVATYAWGRGPRTVLLLHGWRGRASQFAPLVRELVAEGLTVVSFDAPAHGSSGGRRTDIRDWVAAAEALSQEHGRFDALIGHSFGGLAALAAARSAVPVPTVVTIAGAGTPAAFVGEFAREFRLSAPARAQMERRFLGHFGLAERDFLARYDAVRHPLPDDTRLLVVHDRADRRMPDADALRLHAAHEGRSRLLRTEGFGHSRILHADAVLDAVVAELQDAPRPVGSAQQGGA